MNDFTQAYKNKLSGMSGKSVSKNGKKQTTQALHQALQLSISGEVAGIMHLGVQHVMMRMDKFQEAVQNGGQINLTPEQQNFRNLYQKNLQLMQKMDTHNEKENEHFTFFDSLTFEFSDAMNSNKKERDSIIKKFEKYLDENPDIENKSKGRMM